MLEPVADGTHAIATQEIERSHEFSHGGKAREWSAPAISHIGHCAAGRVGSPLPQTRHGAARERERVACGRSCQRLHCACKADRKDQARAYNLYTQLQLKPSILAEFITITIT